MKVLCSQPTRVDEFGQALESGGPSLRAGRVSVHSRLTTPPSSEVASLSGRSEDALLMCVCTRATLLHFMPDPNQKRTNSALWLGLLITVLGPLTNLLLRGSRNCGPVA